MSETIADAKKGSYREKKQKLKEVLKEKFIGIKGLSSFFFTLDTKKNLEKMKEENSDDILENIVNDLYKKSEKSIENKIKHELKLLKQNINEDVLKTLFYNVIISLVCKMEEEKSPLRLFFWRHNVFSGLTIKKSLPKYNLERYPDLAFQNWNESSDTMFVLLTLARFVEKNKYFLDEWIESKLNSLANNYYTALFSYKEYEEYRKNNSVLPDSQKYLYTIKKFKEPEWPKIPIDLSDKDKLFNNRGRLRILSLDGGGVRGILEAQMLKNIFDFLNKDEKVMAAIRVIKGIDKNKKVEFQDFFDVYAGTSTGGIQAAACIKPSEIEDRRYEYDNDGLIALYEGLAGKIFPETYSSLSKIYGFATSTQYSNKTLEQILQQNFEGWKLNNINNARLLITGYNITKNRLDVFSSRIAEKFPYFEYTNPDLVKLLLVTSAAPTYLEAQEIGDSVYVDGGLGANNPSLKATEETMKDYPGKKLFVLSLGTGRSEMLLMSKETAKSNGGVKSAVETLSNTLDASSILTDEYSKFFGIEKNLFEYHRINPKLPQKFELDDSRLQTLNKLKEVANLEMRTLEWGKIMEALALDVIDEVEEMGYKYNQQTREYVEGKQTKSVHFY